MKINGSPAYVKMVKGLIDHQKKSFEGTLKPNNKFFKESSVELPPEIQQMRRLLEDKKKALEKLDVDQTAKKIARGEMITEDEREKLRATDPEKLRKAEEANEKRASVSRRLANAKTKTEVQSILAGEKSMALMIYDKGDQVLGELYLEAVGKAEIDYYQGKKSNSAAFRTDNVTKRAYLFDMRL
ncbi:hypothetical protein [Sporosarcina beigongshangi]|uniref:hypothetical protein n=1 Tax=Sporosarcina beigongshangi TaxID=2782538 RepID=UPI001939897B|nr:hypothetical protein [Sporosarcina beigongshangi]